MVKIEDMIKIEETNDSELLITVGNTSAFNTARKGHPASHTTPFTGMLVIYYC